MGFWTKLLGFFQNPHKAKSLSGKHPNGANAINKIDKPKDTLVLNKSAPPITQTLVSSRSTPTSSRSTTTTASRPSATTARTSSFPMHSTPARRRYEDDDYGSMPNLALAAAVISHTITPPLPQALPEESCPVHDDSNRVSTNTTSNDFGSSWSSGDSGGGDSGGSCGGSSD